jgi:small subunit ribosomal protein S6
MPDQESKTPIYDLTLLLSTGASEEERAKILSEVQSAITSGGGSVERNDDWGVRPLSYGVGHQSEAEYHLLQFTGPGSLLESLSHSLRIADGVIRFRIIKVRNGAPPVPESPPPVMVVAGSHAPAAQPAPES